MYRTFVLALSCFILVQLTGLGFAPAAEPANEILNHLISKDGLPGAGDVALPKPSMADGLDRAGQRAAIVAIADANHPPEALERKSVVAPLVLKIGGDDPAEKQRSLRRVDIWFVAYGKLDTIADESFWKSVRNSGSDRDDQELSTTKTAILTADELRARNITGPEDERHLTADLTLFNRVRVSATMQAKQTRSAESIVLAAMLDPRFAEDQEFPNRWWPLTRDDAGHQQQGQPHPYRTAGWYCKATQLQEPAGAIFVEYHVLFDEPFGWFDGANLLRSKLPLVVQDGVRKFRRHLQQGSGVGGRGSGKATGQLSVVSRQLFASDSPTPGKSPASNGQRTTGN